jgi:hypothetical protein
MRVAAAIGSIRYVIVVSRVPNSGCFSNLRHHDFARRIELGELSAAAVGVAICETDHYARLAADTEIR